LKCGLNMRRWFLLGLCSIASVGGACSSRSLLIIKVTSAEMGGMIEGHPEVEVTQGSDIKRHYPDTAGEMVPILSLVDNGSFGIYLPDGVSGEVEVAVTLTDLESCKAWTGNGPASVSPGGTSNATIKLASEPPPKNACRPMPSNDASSDGADADANSASADGGDIDASHGDGGADASCPTDTSATPPVTCEDYCTLYKANCPDFDPNTTEQCTAACMTAGWPPGTTGEPTGNTISCRLEEARGASSPPQRAMFCPFASANSEVCK
jgi:hypothetical protein